MQSRLPSNPLQLLGVLLELGKIITSPSEMPSKYALIGFSVDHNIDLNWKIAYASLCIEAKHLDEEESFAASHGRIILVISDACQNALAGIIDEGDKLIS